MPFNIILSFLLLFLSDPLPPFVFERVCLKDVVCRSPEEMQVNRDLDARWHPGARGHRERAAHSSSLPVLLAVEGHLKVRTLQGRSRIYFAQTRKVRMRSAAPMRSTRARRLRRLRAESEFCCGGAGTGAVAAFLEVEFRSMRETPDGGNRPKRML